MSNLLIVQVFGTLLVGLMIFVVFRIYQKKKISFYDLVLWEIFWIFVGILVIAPALMSDIAKVFGIGRGVDAIIYVALFLLFYLVFKLSVKIEKVDQNVTQVVKEIALRKKWNIHLFL